MTGRTRLMSYLLYGLFSAILKKNTIKTPEVIFHIRLSALRLSSSLILRRSICMLVFLSVIENIVVFCPSFLLFCPRARSFTHNSKEPWSREPGHYTLLINQEWGHYREISDRGLDVLTERRGLGFPCNDRTDEVNKLFIIWPFLALFLRRIQ